MEGAFPGPGRRTDLLGRASECALLDDVISGVRRGEGRSLVLRGEAGIGKTALLEYLVDCAPDLTVLRAVGVESEMELAYAGLHQLCVPILDRRPGLPQPQRQALETVFGLGSGAAPDPFLVGLAVLSLFSEVSEESCVLCVVDDAQWLDHASALTLAFVARRLLADPVGIVFAAREPGQELRTLPQLELNGLVNGDARALLSSAVMFELDAEIRDRIVAETRGNPLALLELPQGLTATQLAGGFGLVDAEGLSGRIEESFVRRLGALSEDARRLLLLAAAEPAGDPLLLRRAAEGLGIGSSSSADATDGLLSIGCRVTFRHPLVRSAVYRSAAGEQRRAVHAALAEATDRDADPDRHAWHLAAAALGPDEQVAAELESSAGRAQARGGLAAAAAFLEHSVSLSADPARRSARALAAAQVSLGAGDLHAMEALLPVAEAGPLDELQRARAQLLRARLAFVSSHGGDAPPLLLSAAKRLEPLDAGLARETYLETLSAVILTGRAASTDAGLAEVAGAARRAPPARPPRGADLLLDGLAALFVEGRAAGVQILNRALRAFANDAATAESLRWFFTAGVGAVVLWDDEMWHAIRERHVKLARQLGAFSEIPLALTARVFVHLFCGELDTAASLIEEIRVVTEATGTSLAPYVDLQLAARRGRESELAALIDASSDDMARLGQGGGIAQIKTSRAILYNGLGRYEEALAAAQEVGPEDLTGEYWVMAERIEAAVRCGTPEVGANALERLHKLTEGGGTNWGLGLAARCGALLSEGETAESLYREAIARLAHTRLRPELARAHLVYGEWLRRDGRRIDAREQLRPAHQMFTAMGMEAFANRTRRELLATGAKARQRTVETRDVLTAQERQIGELARDGLSNPEIGARLFLSPRTVEWHLRKVFGKLGIHSRHELAGVLAKPGPELVQA